MNQRFDVGRKFFVEHPIAERALFACQFFQRDAFRFSEIAIGASFISIGVFIKLPTPLRVAISCGFVILLVVAVVCCPANPPEKER